MNLTHLLNSNLYLDFKKYQLEDMLLFTTIYVAYNTRWNILSFPEMVLIVLILTVGYRNIITIQIWEKKMIFLKLHYCDMKMGFHGPLVRKLLYSCSTMRKAGSTYL